MPIEYTLAEMIADQLFKLNQLAFWMLEISRVDLIYILLDRSDPKHLTVYKFMIRDLDPAWLYSYAAIHKCRVPERDSDIRNYLKTSSMSLHHYLHYVLKFKKEKI